MAGGSSPSDGVLWEGSDPLDWSSDAEILMGLVLGLVGREERGVLEEEMALMELRERRNEG